MRASSTEATLRQNWVWGDGELLGALDSKQAFLCFLRLRHCGSEPQSFWVPVQQVQPKALVLTFLESVHSLLDTLGMPLLRSILGQELSLACYSASKACPHCRLISRTQTRNKDRSSPDKTIRGDPVPWIDGQLSGALGICVTQWG